MSIRVPSESERKRGNIEGAMSAFLNGRVSMKWLKSEVGEEPANEFWELLKIIESQPLSDSQRERLAQLTSEFKIQSA
jgi:hypothetical protein